MDAATSPAEIAPAPAGRFHDLLTGGRADQRVAALAAAALSRHRPGSGLATYREALARALFEEPPPFGTGLYAEMVARAAAQAPWSAVALIKRAEVAGALARSLESLAERSAAAERRRLHRLATIASEHVHACLDVLATCLPGAIPADFLAQLRSLAPAHTRDRSPDPDLRAPAPPGLGELILVHLESLRSLSLLLMQVPALTRHCPAAAAEEAVQRLDSSIEGGLELVAGSAELIEGHPAARAVAALAAVVERELRRHNRATAEETVDFSYHLRFGSYP